MHQSFVTMPLPAPNLANLPCLTLKNALGECPGFDNLAFFEFQRLYSIFITWGPSLRKHSSAMTSIKYLDCRGNVVDYLQFDG